MRWHWCCPRWNENERPAWGLETLLGGWWGILWRDIPWLANPVYFAAVLFAMYGIRQASQLLCGLAFGVGLFSLREHEWWFNEAHASKAVRLGPAFYFWMASFLVLLVLQYFVREDSRPGRDRGTSLGLDS